VRYEESVTLARAPEEVFAYLADVANLPEWQPSVLEAHLEPEPAGPLGPGSRIAEVRSFLGRRVASTLEVTAHEPPSRLDLAVVEGPVTFRVSHRLERTDDGGTHVTISGEGRASGPLRFAGPLLRGVVERQAREDLVRLKQVLESR
jgi:uncharacterized protein YndB with AHSA1/START domain